MHRPKRKEDIIVDKSPIKRKVTYGGQLKVNKAPIVRSRTKPGEQLSTCGNLDNCADSDDVKDSVQAFLPFTDEIPVLRKKIKKNVDSKDAQT